MKATIYLAFVLLIAQAGLAELLPGDHHIGAAADPGARLPSNSIIDIVPHNGSVWLGTGQGLAEYHTNNGQWSVIGEAQGLGKGGVSAIALNDTIMWVATAYSELIRGTYFPAGGGVGYSRDQGEHWTWMRQPIDSTNVSYSPTTTNIQNVTYDIALSDSSVWIVSWGGGLRRLRYGSDHWEVVTVDGNPFAPLVYYAHRTFAAAFDGHFIWIGSAAGVHRSGDEGHSWTTYGASPGSPGTISGNFVVALGVQKIPTKTLIWAATWRADKVTESYGVCVTDDAGDHWRVALSDSTVLPGGVYLVDEYGPLRCHNFGFQDSTVMVAADGGLWMSRDLGVSWNLNTGPVQDIYDPTLGEHFSTPDFFSASSTGDTLWVGTDDGVAMNPGVGWRIHRAFEPAGVSGQPETYAYPSPFSPRRNQTTRFQFPLTGSATVSFQIFDFAMEPVYESSQTSLPGGGTGDMAGYGAVTWNGLTTAGKSVANGVYFYKVKAAGKTFWGKVMVLD